MATASVTYSNFVNGVAADADQVDQNFTDLVNFLNTEVVHADGAVQMTGALLLKAGTDPSADDEAVRKAYVDDRQMVSDVDNYNISASIPAAGATVSTITISDPGYDIDVWAIGSNICFPASNLDLANIWELKISMGQSGSETHKAGFRIPVVVSQQSLAVYSTVQTFATGSYGGTLSVKLGIIRQGGSQATLGQFGADARYNFMQVFYRKSI